MKIHRFSSKWTLTPACATGICIWLYITTVLLYPRGSQANAHSAGFSRVNNYWCNLLSGKAIYGITNTAGSVAFVAMAALCIKQISFYWLLINVLPFSRLYKTLILLSGGGTIIAGMFFYNFV